MALTGWVPRPDGTGLDLWDGGTLLDSRPFTAEEQLAIDSAKAAPPAPPSIDQRLATVEASVEQLDSIIVAVLS